MSELHVNIVTPERSVWSGAATDVRVPGWEGEFEVLPEHDLFLSLLRGGVLSFTTSGGEQRRFVVGRGFAEASAETVTILADSCEPPDTVDKAQAEHDRVAAEKAVGETADGSPERNAAEEQVELANARLSV